jgi:hypothetical protein
MTRLAASLGLSLFLATALVSQASRAADIETQFQVSSRQIQVGEELSLQLTLMSESQFQAQNARLTLPPGMQAQGPSTSSRTQMSISGNGQMQRQTGVTLTWSVTAAKPGSYRVGPASVEVEGRRYQTQPISIEVLPAGSRGGAPRPGGRGIPFSFDPFSGLGMPRFPGFPFGDDDQPEEEPRVPAAPPEYQLEHAPDPTAFLRARATPKKVVIGQAISLKIYSYGSQGGYSEVSSNEPSREGFLAFDVEPGPNANSAVPVPIEGKVWLAHKTREMVLFPIRTGTLRIGSMRMGFQGRGYPPSAGALGLMRESPPIDITVVEPPLAGRPAGYHLGDVGQYTLTARVEPRSIKQGEAISVIARLEGTGNVPSKLAIPQQNGVDWPEPTVIDKLDADAGKVSGSRTFTFVVRLDRPGSIELGELTLPYYDADQQRYQVARAALGAIEVKPDPTAAQAASAPAASGDRLQGLLAPRKQLGPYQAASTPLSEKSGFFGLLLLGPFSVLAGTGLLRLSKRVAQRLGASRATPARRAIAELEAARDKAQAGDLGATSAACERALHLALEGATGLKGRGVLRSELGSLLVERGLSQKNADEAVSLLEAFELARFADSQAENEASSLFLRCEVLVSSLVRGKLG